MERFHLSLNVQGVSAQAYKEASTKSFSCWGRPLLFTLVGGAGRSPRNIFCVLSYTDIDVICKNKDGMHNRESVRERSRQLYLLAKQKWPNAPAIVGPHVPLDYFLVAGSTWIPLREHDIFNLSRERGKSASRIVQLDARYH